MKEKAQNNELENTFCNIITNYTIKTFCSLKSFWQEKGRRGPNKVIGLKN